MAWASIERHILVFYSNWFATRTKRFFVHYLPLLIALLYPLVFYIIMLIIVPCDIPFNYGCKQCGRYRCVSRISWIGLYDSIGHSMTPAFTTVVFSVALFVRVLCVRYRIQGRIEWKNYKKLTLQFLPISTLYIALQLPPTILYAADTGDVNRSVAASYYLDALNFTYWVILFTPFASALSMPTLRRKCRKMIYFWRGNDSGGLQSPTTTRRNIDRTPTEIATVG